MAKERKVRKTYSLPKLIVDEIERIAEAEDRSMSNVLARELKGLVKLSDSPNALDPYGLSPAARKAK